MEGKSTVKLKERIDAALSSNTPSLPAGAKMVEINKLRNGEMVLQLALKEAVAWLWDLCNEAVFVAKLDADACIADRAYPIVISWVPIIFDPANHEHLREVENINDPPTMTISKVRWIKPEYKSHPKQNYAYTTFSLLQPVQLTNLSETACIFWFKDVPKKIEIQTKAMHEVSQMRTLCNTVLCHHQHL